MYTNVFLTVIPFHKSGHKCFIRSSFKTNNYDTITRHVHQFIAIIRHSSFKVVHFLLSPESFTNDQYNTSIIITGILFEEQQPNVLLIATIITLITM